MSSGSRRNVHVDISVCFQSDTNLKVFSMRQFTQYMYLGFRIICSVHMFAVAADSAVLDLTS